MSVYTGGQRVLLAHCAFGEAKCKEVGRLRRRTTGGGVGDLDEVAAARVAPPPKPACTKFSVATNGGSDEGHERSWRQVISPML